MFVTLPEEVISTLSWVITPLFALAPEKITFEFVPSVFDIELALSPPVKVKVPLFVIVFPVVAIFSASVVKLPLLVSVNSDNCPLFVTVPLFIISALSLPSKFIVFAIT